MPSSPLSVVPIAKTPPTISGIDAVGDTLTATEGTWENNPTGYKYQWQGCSFSGNGCADITAATTNTLTLTAADVEHTVRVIVTATNEGGTTAAVSTPTAPVEETEEEPPPPPVATAMPTISGTDTEGDTLTATNGTWENDPAGYEYQWQDCNAAGANCVDIAGAATDAHKLTATDVGHTLRVVLTATNEGGATTAASNPTAKVQKAEAEPPPPPPAPVVKTLPTISGTDTEGDTLTATNGTWENGPTGYEYQWQDCNTSGSSCTSITAATAGTHKLTAADTGHTLRVIVTATNEGGSTPATSAATATVAKALPPKPKDKTVPTISGTTTEGDTLTATNGTWENNPTGYKYQWQDCNATGGNCLNIAGANANAHKLTAADVGDTLRIVVTATNEGGPTTATSNPTAKVQKAEAEPPPPPPAPVVKTLPTISGTDTEGDTLTATNGTWENGPTGYEYQWQDCNTSGSSCTSITAATAGTHKLTAADTGHTLRVIVTATNEGGSTPATSAATATVAKALPPKPKDKTVPTISGTTTEGDTLTATNGTWENNPTGYKYQWQDCNSSGSSCTSIAAATAGTHKLTAADTGHTLRAIVTATNEGGATAATSAQTAVVVEEPKEEEPKEEPNGETLFISPSGSDSNACTEAKPCQTMKHAYKVAAAGETVRLLSGSYPQQKIEEDGSKSSSSHVIFAPASGASVKFTGAIDILESHITIENMTVQDVTIGNVEADGGKPNPTDITLLNLTGRNFEIASATHITVEGGSWGPATACAEAYTGSYEGNNNAIRQPIPSQAPEYIVINKTIIHNVQSDSFLNCHIEGLAIFAGNHVTVSNTKFYENSVYDIFMQSNSGGNPDNIILKGNWFATAVDTTGKNGEAVGQGDGIAVGNELSENVTLEDNHFNDVLNMADAGESSFHNIRVVGNVGIQAYANYPCGSLSGIEWSKNIWQNDKCGLSDVDLDGAALPYVNTANNSTLDYELTGKYAGWPEETKEEAKKEEEKPKEEGKKEEGSAGTLYLSPSGSDSAACTAGAPCKTLAHAYSLAKSGEKVVLAAGTYTDTSLPLTSGKTTSSPVVFEPASGAAVKFSKEVRVEAHGAELKGFKFERELYFGENAEGDTSRDNALHNFEIISGGSKAPKSISIIGGTAGPVADGSDNENNLIATNGPETTAVPTKITVEGVLIHEYTKVGEAHVDCLQIWGGNEITIQDNTFKKCSVFDIFLQSLPNGDAGTPKNVTIQNNYLEKTIEGYFSIFMPHHNEGNSEHYENIDIRNNSATQAIVADPRATFTNVKFDGNIAPSLLFWNEATEVDQGVPSGAEAEYNVWYGGEGKKYGTHDQLAAAGFADEATLDLELTAGAAAIKHGDPGNYPATDINGNTRTNPPDAGAAQYTG